MTLIALPEPQAVAGTVVACHVGAQPTQIAPQTGGLSNHVVAVDTPDGPYIVRLGEGPEKLAAFERERRAVERVRAAGVPTQEIVALGRAGAWAYTIARRLPGAPAVDHPERLRVLEDLGRLAAVVHTIATVGCGRYFGWPGEVEPDGSAWAAFLHVELAAEQRLWRLRAHGLLTEHQHEALEATLAEVARWDGPTVLNHGDLRLKNVLVDIRGSIVGLIDWDTCVSSIGPHWDLSLALHDLSIDAKQAFLAGYGMPEDAVRRAAPVWHLFNVLNYAPELERLLAAADFPAVERMRTRLSGALDLYSAGHR